MSFEHAATEGGNILIAANELYLAIRDDIGLSNWGLSDNELVKMYLKNPAEIDTLIASNKHSHDQPA